MSCQFKMPYNGQGLAKAGFWKHHTSHSH